jgi:hypothetical protein
MGDADCGVHKACLYTVPVLAVTQSLMMYVFLNAPPGGSESRRQFLTSLGPGK